VRKADNLPPSCALVMKSGNLNFLEPSGPLWFCNGTDLLYIVPLIRHTIVFCINSISPMAIGCFICVNINLIIVLIDISNFVISGGILFKILVLGINEMVSCLSLLILIFYLQDQYFC